MQLNRLTALLFFTPIIVALTLQGCGSPGAGGGSTTQPVTDPFVAVTTVQLRIEANEEILGRPLPNDGLNELDVDDLNLSQISLVALDENFEARGLSSIPSHRIVLGESDGLNNEDAYYVEFNSNFQGQLDIVVRVRFDSGAVLYAPLDNIANRSNTAVTINVFSHYILQKLYETISTEDELDSLIPCSSDTCTEQAYLKADLMNNLNDTIQFYDIEIANDATHTELLAQFDNNADLRNLVETAVNEVTRSVNPAHQGTQRTLNLLDSDVEECLNTARDYHGVWFGIMLNDVLPDDNQNEVLFARAIATEAASDTFPNNNSTLYPILSVNTQLYENRREGATIKNYFARDTLTLNSDDSIVLDTSEPIRRWESSTSDTTLSTEGYLLYDRTFPQRIEDGPSDTDTIGRLLNPAYSRLYKTNAFDCPTEPDDAGDAPTWFVGSNANTGSEYQLEVNNGNLVTDENDNFIRDFQRESQNLFTWEIHGLETETLIDEDDLNGNEYGALSFAVEFSETSEIVGVFGDTLHWEHNGNDIIENQPNNHYASYSIARNDDGSRKALTESSDLITNFARSFSREDSSGSSPELSRLVRLDGGSRPSLGHLSHNNKHIAFNIDSLDSINDKGQGILIATELRAGADTPRFSDDGENYQLMGNLIALTDTHDQLTNVNGSNLLIADSNSEDCEATLSLLTRGVEHDISDNSLDEHVSSSYPDAVSSFCRLGSSNNGSEIELRFDNVNGAALTLKGFVAQQDIADEIGEAGTFIPMLWLQDDTLGLIFANLDLNLSEGFE